MRRGQGTTRSPATSSTGAKQITFTWKKPFADYRDLFGTDLSRRPAVVGQDFNKFWSNCVCGNDGKPVSDGPFYVSNYTKGQGATLKANPDWYGAKPKLAEVDFKIITDTNSEIQAMRGGEVDAIDPSPQTALSQLRGQPNLVYSAINAYYQEHVDIQYGPKGNPLLKAPWFRHALMMGMDRVLADQGAVQPDRSGQKPLNNLEYVTGETAIPHFAIWNFNQKKATRCSRRTAREARPSRRRTTPPSGPAAASRPRSSTRRRRATSAAPRARPSSTQQLKSIGIQLDANIKPSTTVFGTDLPNHDFDLAEYAWVTAPDPSGFDAIWGCGGDSNYTSYCNHKVTALFAAGDQELDPTKRFADYSNADKLMANDIPAVPLYCAAEHLRLQEGDHRHDRTANNPTTVGPTWNIETWAWSS